MKMNIAMIEKASYLDCKGGEVIPVIDRSALDAQWVYKTIKVMKRISQTQGDFYQVVERNGVGRASTPEYSAKQCIKDALNLVFLLRDGFAAELAKIFPKYHLNPYFRILIDNEAYGEVSLAIPCLIKGKGPEVPKAVKAINAFVEALRRDMARPEFKSAVRNFERAANKNHQSLKRYIDSLFNRYSKLLVIRLDLEYRLNEAKKQSWGLRLSYEAVARHRVAFFRTLSDHLEEKLGRRLLVGFVWKLEYGLVNGWHYHAIVFIDGQKAMQDVNIGKVIGEYWQEVTGHLGRYYNCNAVKTSYERLGKLGIGLIGYQDSELRSNLENTVATYLTKVDAFAKLVLPFRARGMGRGVIRDKGKVRRGRPRKSSEVHVQGLYRE